MAGPSSGPVLFTVARIFKNHHNFSFTLPYTIMTADIFIHDKKLKMLIASPAYLQNCYSTVQRQPGDATCPRNGKAAKSTKNGESSENAAVGVPV
jgi:hypothetical protein